MLATIKYPEARGIDAATEFYGFYVRTQGPIRARLLKARESVAQHYGAPPSNALLLRELLEAFDAQRPAHGI
jgi:hypothetical protein